MTSASMRFAAARARAPCLLAWRRPVFCAFRVWRARVRHRPRRYCNVLSRPGANCYRPLICYAIIINSNPVCKTLVSNFCVVSRLCRALEAIPNSPSPLHHERPTPLPYIFQFPSFFAFCNHIHEDAFTKSYPARPASAWTRLSSRNTICM